MRRKRAFSFIAIFMATFLVVGMVPTSVLAEDDEETDEYGIVTLDASDVEEKEEEEEEVNQAEAIIEDENTETKVEEVESKVEVLSDKTEQIEETENLSGGIEQVEDNMDDEEESSPQMLAAEPEGFIGTFYDYDELCAAVREKLVNRETNLFTVAYVMDEDPGEDYKSVWSDIRYDVCFGHTGNGQEGDYLEQYEIMQSGFDYYDKTDDSYVGCNMAQWAYQFDWSTTAEQEAEVTAKLAEVYDSFNWVHVTTYDKLKDIYDYIRANVSYNETTDKCYTAYGALIEGEAKCSGYAILLYRMANDCGIDTRFIGGHLGSSSGLAHAWDICEIAGQYYICDATLGQFLKGTESLSNYRPNSSYANIMSSYAMSETDFDPNTTDLSGEITHTYGDWVTIQEATCQTPGIERRTCIYCDVYEERETDLGDHSYGEVLTQEPTCTEKGKIYRVCSVCGYEDVLEELDMIDHDYKLTEIIDPTCTDEGEEIYKCSMCGETKTEVIAALGHSWDDGEETTAPTCTEDGVMTYTCTVCGATKTEAIAALGHSWDDGEETTAPTCTEDGVVTYTCTVCGATKTEAIAALGHSWDDGEETTAPTCTEDGVVTYTCTVCGETKTEAISALGHDWDDGEVVTAPTCTGEGATLYTCNRCGETMIKVVDATGHTPVTDPAVAATCTKSGLTEGSHCSVCGAVIVEQEVVPVTDHDYEQVGDWVWSDDYTMATLAVKCQVCEDERTFVATIADGTIIAVKNTDGSTVYMASVTYGDETFTDEVQVEGEKESTTKGQNTGSGTGSGDTGSENSGNGDTGSVKTGDTNNIAIWLVLLIAGAAVAVAGFAMKRRQH